MPEDFSARLAQWRAEVDETLAEHLPPEGTQPAVIHEAMRYAVLGGGKRIRPILAIAAAQACGADTKPLMAHLCALELIHTYSLVHDDLPALDNDDLRRGRKTTHVVFGEAMAILAGDALLTEAFSWLAREIPGVDPARQLRAIADVALAVDSKGMIGGQVADIVAERSQQQSTDHAALLDELHFIHRNKTGKLLTASVVLGGQLGGATGEQLVVLRTYGDAIGLAFQIVDDLLDIEEDSASVEPEDVERSFVAASIDEALKRLPTGARTVFVMHDIEGYTHEEIAEELGITSGGSKSQLFKARAKLRTLLAHLVDIPTAGTGSAHATPVC